jgi:hypothetical protein
MIACSTLALLGTFVTVVAMVVGPAFQQTIEFYTSSVIDYELAAYASAAKTYNGTTVPSNVNDYTNIGTLSCSLVVAKIADCFSHAPCLGLYTPFNMKSAMYSGLISSGMVALPTAPYACPTGNCTWDPFPTLAVSMECIDTEKYYTLNCSPDEEQESLYPTPRCKIDQTPLLAELQENWINRYQTGSSPRFHTSATDKASDSPVLFLGSYYASWVDLLPSTWKKTPTAGLTELQWVRASQLYTSNGTTEPYIYNGSRLESRWCIIYTVMQEIRARVENGLYSEEVLREESRADNADDFDGTRLLVVPGSDYNPPINYTFKGACKSPSIETHCEERPSTVSLSLAANSYLLAGLNFIFSDVGQDNVTTSTQSGLVGPQILKMIYQSPNITKAIENVAYYMTMALRSNDTTLAFQNDPANSTGLASDYIAPSHRVAGYAYINKVHLAVTWYWLSLPAVLLVCAAVLLACTIRATHDHDVGVWKDSPLAILAHTQWGEHPTTMGGSTSAEIETSVQGVQARLVGKRFWISDGGRERRKGWIQTDAVT